MLLLGRIGSGRSFGEETALGSLLVAERLLPLPSPFCCRFPTTGSVTSRIGGRSVCGMTSSKRASRPAASVCSTALLLLLLLLLLLKGV